MQVAGSKEQVAGSRDSLGVASDAAPAEGSRRGTRLPENFGIPTDQKDWFAKNCPHVDVRVQHQLFVNYWLAKAGQGAAKRDWIRTWQNWMLKAEQEAPRSGRSGSRPRSTTDDRVAMALEAGERVQAMIDGQGEQ